MAEFELSFVNDGMPHATHTVVVFTGQSDDEDRYRYGAEVWTRFVGSGYGDRIEQDRPEPGQTHYWEAQDSLTTPGLVVATGCWSLNPDALEEGLAAAIAVAEDRRRARLLVLLPRDHQMDPFDIYDGLTAGLGPLRRAVSSTVKSVDFVCGDADVCLDFKWRYDKIARHIFQRQDPT